MEQQDSQKPHTSTGSSGVNSTMPNRPKPSVVRCLFPEEGVNRETYDNSKNTLKEIRAADVEKMRVKWNYDAENDRPLDGVVRWEKSDDTRYHYIGVVPNELDKETCEKEDHSNQVEEGNAQCNTKVVDEIVDATCEGSEKV